MGAPRRTACPVVLRCSRSTQPSTFVVTAAMRRSSRAIVPTALIVRMKRSRLWAGRDDAETLHFLAAVHDRRAVVRFLAFVDGDVVHPHGVLFRRLRDV